MRTALLLACALVAAINAAPKPKTTPYVFPGLNTGKIVGGIEAGRHEFKFLVDMRRGSHYCAGSIISPDWVVTAAHCSQGAPSAYTLVAGDHNINVVEGTEQTRQVVQIINHPNYGSPKQYENDIALMKVSPPFVFDEYVQAVVIPDVNFAPTAVATVTGWGALTEGGSSPTNLMKVDVPHVDDETCSTNYGGSTAPSMVCYGEGGKDSCQGDSGGPIVCGDDQTLCGIVSWGQGCARPNYPGVYTETSYFTEWIRGSTIPTEEDPSPVESITTCGGRIDASSAEITYQLGSSIRADQKCVWIVKAPYDSLRFRLTSSGLGEGDGIYLTNFANSQPGAQQRMTSTGQNYTVTSGFVLVTLSVGNAPTRGFRLEFFSSGFSDATRDFTGFASLNTNSGNLSYPIGGGSYLNNENALFVINPIVPAMRTVMFTRMNVENDSTCSYDAVTIYNFFNNEYIQVAKRCGTTLPPSTTLESGVGLVTFTTDSSVVGTGFDFEWV
jgi:trypsin